MSLDRNAIPLFQHCSWHSLSHGAVCDSLQVCCNPSTGGNSNVHCRSSVLVLRGTSLFVSSQDEEPTSQRRRQQFAQKHHGERHHHHRTSRTVRRTTEGEVAEQHQGINKSYQSGENNLHWQPLVPPPRPPEPSSPQLVERSSASRTDLTTPAGG